MIFSAGILYTFNQTKIYQAEGMLEVLDSRPVKSLSLEDLLVEEPIPESGGKKQESLEEEELAAEAEDLNTAFQVLSSRSILMGVEQRIRGESRERFMAPYVDAINISGPLSPMEILDANRTVEKESLSKIFRVRYVHPDPVIAAEVANLFMKEFIDYYLKLEIDGYMKMVEDLRIRIEQTDDQIQEKVDQLNRLLADKDGNANAIQIMSAEKDTLIDFRTTLYTAFNESKLRVNMANPRARIVDAAFPPYEDQPFKPDIRKNLSYAFGLGLLLALLPHLWVAIVSKGRI